MLLIYSGKGVKMVNTHDILLSFSRRVKDILDDKLTKIILYGSYARGDYRENSDIAFPSISISRIPFSAWPGFCISI